MHEVSYTLSDDEDPNQVLEDRSVNCMSWFTGLILPGRSMPFVLMNALTDCDPDTPPAFHDLLCTLPNVGFQFRGHTYWSWECIVGKVLGAAKGVNQIAGWLGPCISSPDLDRAQVAYINQQNTANIIRLTAADVRNMQAASDPLGPLSRSKYRTEDYDLIIPDPSAPTDTIRIERLNFTPAPPASPGSAGHIQRGNIILEETPLPPTPAVPPTPVSLTPAPVPGGVGLGLGIINVPGAGSGTGMNDSLAGSIHKHIPPPVKRSVMTFDASITFAIRHRSWKVNLRYDTPFIAAYPCTGGPHVLYNKYYYHAVKVDSLVDIEDWGPNRVPRPPPSSGKAGARRRPRYPSHHRRHPDDSETDSSISESESDDEDGDYDDLRDDDDDDDNPTSDRDGSRSSRGGNDDHLKLNNHLDDVLVVEAFGVHDNEVFARAWCSFWGVAAIMADLKRTCLACCVREAYATGVSVVVLVDSGPGRGDDEVEEVDRKMEGL